MSRQRIRHFAVALILSAVLLTASAGQAVAKAATPATTVSLSSLASAKELHFPVTSVAAHTNREVFGFALASSLADASYGYPSWNFSMLSTVAYFGLAPCMAKGRKNG